MAVEIVIYLAHAAPTDHRVVLSEQFETLSYWMAYSCKKQGNLIVLGQLLVLLFDYLVLEALWLILIASFKYIQMPLRLPI
jgi:hypothetical protein